MTGSAHQPVLYGQPGHIAVLMACVANLIEREPDAVFLDPSVQDVGHRLAGLIQRRIAGPCRVERPVEGEAS